MPTTSELQKLDEALCKRSRDVGACTSSFLKTIEALRSQGQHDVETIWNAACFLNLLDQDISAFEYFVVASDDHWAQQAAARALVTIVFEGIDDIQTIFGKDFISACETAGILDSVEYDRRASLKRVSDFRRTHEQMLIELRHHSLAHRDHDIAQFIIATCRTDTAEIVRVAIEFGRLVLDLSAFASRVIDRANESYRKRGIIP